MKKIFKRILSPDGKNMIPKDQDVMSYLLINGGIEIAGVNSETGEFLYVFTSKIKELMPTLYEDHLNFVNSEIMFLWEKGFVNVDLMADNPIVTLTRKSFIPDALESLTKQQRWSLDEIKRLLKRREV